MNNVISQVATVAAACQSKLCRLDSSQMPRTRTPQQTPLGEQSRRQSWSVLGAPSVSPLICLNAVAAGMIVSSITSQQTNILLWTSAQWRGGTRCQILVYCPQRNRLA